MFHKFQTAILAVLLLLVSTYCAAECVVGPCHSAHEAKQSQPAPCHQSKEKQPSDDAPSCLHSQLVMDSQPVVHLAAELVPMDFVAILPSEFTLTPTLAAPDASILLAGPPAPWPSRVLTTSLRI